MKYNHDKVTNEDNSLPIINDKSIKTEQDFIIKYHIDKNKRTSEVNVSKNLQDNMIYLKNPNSLLIIFLNENIVNYMKKKSIMIIKNKKMKFL